MVLNVEYQHDLESDECQKTIQFLSFSNNKISFNIFPIIIENYVLNHNSHNLYHSH